MVNPTAAMASTAAVTRPKPNDARNRLIDVPLGHRSQLVSGDVAGHLDGAGAVVGVDLEDAGGVVEGVEAGRTARPFVTDGLARLERGEALGEGVHDHGAWRAVADLLDVRRVHARRRG